MTRKIIHVDLDAFFCAVEVLKDPSLAKKPFAVGGRPNERGVVSSCSYSARQFGVRSAMPMARAIRLCPDLLVISPRHTDYSKASQQVMELIHQVSPLVEQISIDEAFVDISDLHQQIEIVAATLQSEIKQKLGLPCSIGCASNKLVAKIATDVGKSIKRGQDAPQAIEVVPEGQEAQYLAGLPVQYLWGIGPKTANRLAELNILLIGDLAKKNDYELNLLFGNMGSEIGMRARGIDNSPVVLEHEIKSVSQEITYIRDVGKQDVLLSTISELCNQVSKRLQEINKKGSTIKLKIRWSDFSVITRQITLAQPTNQNTELFDAAKSLLVKNWDGNKPIRLIGVGVSALTSGVYQIGLWDRREDQRLTQAIMEIKSRFGDKALQRGRRLK